MNYRLAIIFLALAFARPFGWCMVRAMVPETEAAASQMVPDANKGCQACHVDNDESPDGQSESSDESEHPCCQRSFRVVSPKPSDTDSAPPLSLNDVVDLVIYEPALAPMAIEGERRDQPVLLVDRSSILLRLRCALLI